MDNGEDFQRRLKVHNRKYNRFLMSPGPEISEGYSV